MGRKDVRESAALKALGDAGKKQAQAARILASTPRDADRGRDDALRAITLLKDASALVESAVTNAEEFKKSAQTRGAADLLAKAESYRGQFDDLEIIRDTLTNPHSSSNQKRLADTLKGKAKAVAGDQLKNELMTRLAQYATQHTVDGLITVLSNVPINSTTVRWAGGAVSEGLEYARGKWRRANTGVADDGTCDSRRQCHNCRSNARDGGMRTCQNLYR